VILDPDVEAFRAAWQTAARHEVTEKTDAGVLAALDRLALGVRRKFVAGGTAESAIKPFQAAIAKPDRSTSDPASLQAVVSRDGDRLIIDVRMGYASSVSAFDAKGNRLEVPPAMRWSYRKFGFTFRSGSLLAFNGTSLSDAGVRYDYDLRWLRRTKRGYIGAGLTQGHWNYNSQASHLQIKGDRVTLLSLDEPKAFFTDNATLLLRRQEVWSGGVRRSVKLFDQDLRAADAWLATHRPRSERRFLLGHLSGPNWVELEFDQEKQSKFRFELGRKGKGWAVRKVTVS